MRASDIGTSRVIQMSDEASVSEAVRTMRNHDVGCVVVVGHADAHGKPVGIVTDRDLALRASAYANGNDAMLRDVASTPLVVCRPDATVDELVSMMLGSHVRRIPIVDGDGGLIGIVSVDDVMTVLATLMQRVAQTLTSERIID